MVMYHDHASDSPGVRNQQPGRRAVDQRMYAMLQPKISSFHRSVGHTAVRVAEFCSSAVTWCLGRGLASTDTQVPCPFFRLIAGLDTRRVERVQGISVCCVDPMLWIGQRLRTWS